MTRPSTVAVLGLLTEAGDAGELASVMARAFGEPESLQVRNSAVNNILAELARTGRVRRSAAREQSPFAPRGRSWRWYITEKGLREKRQPLLTLSLVQRHTLEAWAREPGELGVRAAAILAIAEGGSLSAVAAELGVAAGSVRSWLKRIRKSGPDGLRQGLGSPLALPPGQRRTLETWAGTPAEGVRAQAIVALADGMPVTEIAATFGVSRSAVRCWRQQFEAAGPEGLRTRQRGGPTYRLVITSEDRLMLERWTQSERLGLRARIVLACAEADAVASQVAAQLRTSPGAVAMWRKRYAESGLNGLVPD